MIIDTSKSLSANDLLAAIHPGGHTSGFLVAQYDSGKKLLRTKLPAEQVDWFLRQIQGSRHLSVTCSAYIGKKILPNFHSTRALTVELDLKQVPGIRNPDHLFDQICSRLDAAQIPHPSALSVTPNSCTVLWIAEKSFDFSELGDVHAAEVGLSTALRDLGSLSGARAASRAVRIPQATPIDGYAAAVVGRHGSIKTVSSARLIRAAQSGLLVSQVSAFNQNIEVIEELSWLLRSRSIHVARNPELYWIWLSCYAAAAGCFSDIQEVKEIVRSVAESLENSPWNHVRSRRVPNQLHKYESFLDILIRNLRDQQVCLDPRSYYPISEDAWAAKAAELLQISQREINELRLKHLLPRTAARNTATYVRVPIREVLGKDDYVPLQHFLLEAA